MIVFLLLFLNLVLVPGNTTIPGLRGEICGGGKVIETRLSPNTLF